MPFFLHSKIWKVVKTGMTTNFSVQFSKMKNKEEIKLLTRQWQLLCHSSICLMVHMKPELYPFNTGKKHMDLVCWSYRMILSFLFCNNLAFGVSEPWPFQGLLFGGSFHSHLQSCSHPRWESAALFFLTNHFLKSSGSPLHIPSPASKQLPQQLSPGFIYRFYWHCCHSKCCPADREIEKSRASIGEPEPCAESVPLPLQNLLPLKNSFHLHWQTLYYLLYLSHSL